MEPISTFSISQLLASIFIALFFGVNVPMQDTQPIIPPLEQLNEEIIFDTNQADNNIEDNSDNISDTKNNGKVQIKIFTDFECPYCASLAKEIKVLHERDDLEISLFHFPLSNHTSARPAAKAVICAEKQNKLWEMHNEIFADQGNLNAEGFRSKAEKLELDSKVFDECLVNEEIEQRIKDDIALAIKMGVDATPTIFIDNTKVVGAVPIENLEKIIRKHQN